MKINWIRLVIRPPPPLSSSFSSAILSPVLALTIGRLAGEPVDGGYLSLVEMAVRTRFPDREHHPFLVTAVVVTSIPW